MRLIRLLIALAFLALGVAVGVLNAQPVAVDFGLITLHASLGVCVLVALLSGLVVGGVVISAGVVLPLHRRLRVATRDRQTRIEPQEPGAR
jgi:putative membrane protein